ncbi:MAG: SMI1/KNR4 family protein [Cycloclasticus sp.]|nr:SMI1/KNR4 family protein [Cycloclasticus sp.]MBG96530.1 SMI1/KNR4 family protein [Cycloclasticus sp.]HAI97274.1 SMI1/KNR4 family protein [Methylococcaceae bacterium]|tara:strand:+ start:127 stop:603 length:477 start_codon:yes stop_codon:yes gene_type:complete
MEVLSTYIQSIRGQWLPLINTVIAKERSVPFNLSEEQLLQTEKELGCTLPNEYRESMKSENGGEAQTKEDDWEFYPIKDTSDRKRVSRTCNHIIKETDSYKGFRNFPENALAIASNGLGDQMVFIIESGQYQSTVYLWLHETGELQELAASFSEIVKL